MNDLERFRAVMEYDPVDRVPNWEVGVWPQTCERWATEGLDPLSLHWDWTAGEEALGMDPKEHVPFNGWPVPLFEAEAVEEDERTQVYRDERGRLRRRLKEGLIGEATMSMDQYLRHPVETSADWEEWRANRSCCTARFGRTRPGPHRSRGGSPAWQGGRAPTAGSARRKPATRRAAPPHACPAAGDGEQGKAATSTGGVHKGARCQTRKGRNVDRQ